MLKRSRTKKFYEGYPKMMTTAFNSAYEQEHFNGMGDKGSVTEWGSSPQRLDQFWIHSVYYPMDMGDRSMELTILVHPVLKRKVYKDYSPSWIICLHEMGLNYGQQQLVPFGPKCNSQLQNSCLRPTFLISPS
jgi:hypothetical protein